jgi:hypothetical protein
MVLSSCGTFIGFTASLSLGKVRRLPGGLPKSSARYDLAVVVSRPVSIFLRVLTGFFIATPQLDVIFLSALTTIFRTRTAIRTGRRQRSYCRALQRPRVL